MTKSVLALAFEAGLNPFNPIPVSVNARRSVGDIAATLLDKRNPYFDKEYRDRFGTKVHSIELSPYRLAMGAVESAQPQGVKDRRYRAVLFRCDGEVLYQTPDDRLLDANGANVDLRYRMGQLDEGAILRQLLQQQCRAGKRMVDNAEKALAMLAALGPGP